MTMPAYIPGSGAFCANTQHIHYHGPCECSSDCYGAPFDHSRQPVMQDVVRTALDIHAELTGASEDLNDDQRENLARILVSRLAFWTPSSGVHRSAEVDAAVQELLRAVLREWCDAVADWTGAPREEQSYKDHNCLKG